MSKQYYDSALTGAEIDKALKAVSDLVTQNNNGKILTIENGKFAAKKPSEIAGTAVLETLNVSENGDYYPESGVDGFDEVHVSVPSYPEPTGTIQISSNGTVNVKDYASAEVNVPSGITVADEGKVVKNGALVAQTARATAITENGTYDTTENNEVTVNISGSSAVVQPLSVAQNGTYNPPSGVDGYAPVTVNVSGGTSLIANWDFKTSLTDSVNGLTAALVNGATRDGNGVEIADTSAYVDLPIVVFAGIRTFEIDVGSMSFQDSGHHRFFMIGVNNGLIYRNNGKWSFYSSKWATDSDISDYDFFANSTVKIYVDENYYWHIYKNGTLVYEPNIQRAPSSSFAIGSSGNSLYQAVIEGLRVY